MSKVFEGISYKNQHNTGKILLATKTEASSNEKTELSHTAPPDSCGTIPENDHRQRKAYQFHPRFGHQVQRPNSYTHQARPERHFHTSIMRCQD